MTRKLSQEQINKAAWAACDTFRGTIDPANYKDYILTMLFLKYMSDLWLDRKAEYEARYKGNAARVERALSRERFVMPPESDYYYLYENRDRPNIGELINIALERIEEENKEKLENVFRNIDFNSEPFLGATRERNRRLRSLLEDFHRDELDFHKDHVGHLDVLGNTYEYLIGRFAAQAGKKAGEFFTPPEVSLLLARLIGPKPGDRICDPTCGSGSLLLKVAAEIPDGNCALYGQEMNGSTWALCRMNMFLHERDSARIEWGDTLNHPRLVEDDALMKFDVVVANPPFSLDKWGQEDAGADPFQRYWRGIPPKSKGDYAFITHMIETAVENSGRVGVVVPHGVLFRGGAEGKIRRRLIDENLLEAGWSGCPPICSSGRASPRPWCSSTGARPTRRSSSSTPAGRSRRVPTRTGCARKTSRGSSRPGGGAGRWTSTRTSPPSRRSGTTTTTSTSPATWTPSKRKRRSTSRPCRKRLTIWRPNWSGPGKRWLSI